MPTSSTPPGTETTPGSLMVFRKFAERPQVEHRDAADGVVDTVGALSGNGGVKNHTAGVLRGFDARYVPYLRAAEERHFWFRARNAIIGALVRQIEAELTPGYRVLEIGCGTGNTLRVLHAICTRGSVLGIDFQREGLAYARERVRCPMVQGDVSAAPFGPSVRFDLIGMFDVLEHIDDDREVLASVRARMAPGAAFLLTVPAAPALWSSFDEAAGHRRRYTNDELSGKLARAGFRVEYLSPFMLVPYPLMWAKRLLANRFRSREGSACIVEELKVVPILNSAMTFVVSREVPLIRSRRHLPFGTSLIAIARPS